jgi:hypothetical protein
MTITTRLALTMAAAFAAAVSLGTSLAASEATIRTDPESVIVGGEPISVAGTGLSSCSGSSLTVSLTFPAANEEGFRQPVAESSRLNPVQVAVDHSGSFSTEVAPPAAFPDEWLGYVVVEGECIDVAVKRLLARVYVSVALGSSVADTLGISQQEGAVLVVPAADIRSYPIMVDDPVKDPYVKLAPFVAVRQDGQECGRAQGDDRNSRGDILIPLSTTCSADGTLVGLRVLSTGHLLDTQLGVVSGHASGVRMVFPPPGTGEAPVPAPPSAGNAALSLDSDSSAARTVWLVSFGSACAAALTLVAVRRRFG